jgi:hypothetical protein
MNIARMFLFFVVCIGARAYLTFLTKGASSNTLRSVYAPLFTAIAIGLGLVYTFRLRETAGETFGDDSVWWDSLRPVHSGLYAIAAMYAVRGDTKHAYMPLAIDVLLGFMATFHHRILLKK